MELYSSEKISFPIRLTPLSSERISKSPKTILRQKVIFEQYTDEVYLFFFQIFWFIPPQPFTWNSESVKLEPTKGTRFNLHLTLFPYYIFSLIFPFLASLTLLALLVVETMSLSMSTLTLSLATYALTNFFANICIIFKMNHIILGFNQFLKVTSQLSLIPMQELSSSRYYMDDGPYEADKLHLPPSLKFKRSILKLIMTTLFAVPLSAGVFFLVEKQGPLHFIGDKVFAYIFGHEPKTNFEIVLAFLGKLASAAIFLVDLSKTGCVLICSCLILIDMYKQYFNYLDTYQSRGGRVINLTDGLLRKYRCLQIMHKNCQIFVDQLLFVVITSFTMLLMEMTWITLKGWGRVPLSIYWIAPISVMQSASSVSLALVGLSVANEKSTSLLEKWRKVSGWRSKRTKKQIDALVPIRFRCNRYFRVNSWSQIKYFAVSTEWIVNTLLTF